MDRYRLTYFPESGGCYKVALMLAATGVDWEPVLVDFFTGVTRDPKWREQNNEMGELPILEHGGKKLTQSAVILMYLAEQTGQFGWKDEDEKREMLRWLFFDNHKFTSYFVTHRFLRCGWLAPGIPDPGVLAFLRGRIDAAFGIVEKHLAKTPFILGDRPTIVDFSMSAYPFYPKEETAYDLPATHPNIAAWLDRIRAIKGWKPPYEMFPGKRQRRWEWMQLPE